MKRLVIILTSFIVAYWLFSQGEWHTNRNINNRLPVGKLIQIDKYLFTDSLDYQWRLQPDSKNKLHQPNNTVKKPVKPYPNVKGDIDFNYKYPNLKFTCNAKYGGSFEAILQPNGSFLKKGSNRGTFNYADPTGFIGSVKHLFVDLIPHLLNSRYK